MSNKTALVTGGGTGIGKGIALRLAEAGYDVAVHCCGSLAGAEDTVNKIRSLGRQAELLQADLSKACEIKRMFDQFKSMFGSLNLYVNNAGITKKSAFLDTTEEIFDSICKVDYKGAFFCMQAAARLMIQNETPGSIILISSNNSRTHFADVSVYGSVKAAAEKMAEHAAIELARYGIRVNNIAPGWTDTGAARLDLKENTYYKIPLRKWTTPKEIGDAVIFLANAPSVTGITLTIDNGALLVSDRAERYGF